MSGVQFPVGFRCERLHARHSRKTFQSDESAVDEWLRTRALQNQEKHLSVTKALLDESQVMAGYYTLATGQVDFGDLPAEITRRLPRRFLPVAVLAWLGVNRTHQRRGLGRLLLAQALRDCHEAGQTFAFVAVILDCLNDSAKRFYRQWDFEELPGHPYRLFLSAQCLELLMNEP
ncbi:MAG: GNAT family N-acetyltransferase [Planctomycetaceae bacterium]|nr:GNAT family N-acetyltransferase [Planctomycetaceae bacterium]